MAPSAMPHTPAQARPRKGSLLQKFAAMKRALMADGSEFRKNLDAFLDAKTGLTIAGVIVGGIVVAFIGMKLLAAMAPQYFTSLATVVGVFTATTVSTGDTTADAIKPILGTVLAVFGLLGLVGLAIAVIVVKFRKTA